MSPNVSEKERPFSGAIIGFGNVAARAHVPAFQKDPRFRIRAVVEPDPERARTAKHLLPDVRVFSSPEELFDRDTVDFVDICTPPCFHGELILKACKAGCHVFCEKPLVTSIEDMERIVHALGDAPSIVFTVNNWKYAPLWQETIRAVTEGRIGRVESVKINVLRTPTSGGGATDWRRRATIAGGGILLDHGWHNLYLTCALLSQAPLGVQASMKDLPEDGSRMEETVNLFLEFEKAQAHIFMTWRAEARGNLGEVLGSEGTIKMMDDHILLSCPDASPSRLSFSESLSGSSHHPEWMDAVVESFHRELTDPEARGGNFQEALLCARITQLAYQSHQEGSRTLPLDQPASVKTAAP